MSPSPSRAASGGSRSLWALSVVGAAALGLGGGLRLGLPGPAEQGVAAAPAPAVRFAAHAVGTISRTTGLAAVPGGPGELPVPAGTALRVGGRVRVPAGLGVREVYWVSYTDGAGPRYGFVVADDVLLTAGDPPLLHLAGVPDAALRAPQPAAHPATPGAPEPPAGERVGSGGEADAGPGAAVVVPAGLDVPWLPETVARWGDLLAAAAARHGVDPELLAIVTLVESGGGPRAVSPAGAVGLMQVMPATAAGIAQERGLAGHATARLYEPAYNVDFGAYYLAQQLAGFGLADDPDWQRSVERAAAAYNGGPGALGKALSGATLPAETARYQGWVGGMWRERRAARSATFERWWAAGGQELVARAAER